MAMGRRKKRVRQEGLWTPTAALPVGASHPFYQRLNQILDEKKFDEYVEAICEDFYAGEVGRPGLSPGIYFRLLMVGYFEGIDSERGIAWRASDSLSIRSFVRIALDESVPDHSTISRTRRLMDVETHQAVFQWVLQVLAEKKLLKGTTIGVDATTLEANAALRSIVRRDTGEKLRRVPDAAGQRKRHRNAHARAVSEAGSQASEEGIQRRLEASARSRRAHHQDEGWSHASGSQGRARGGHGDRSDCRRHAARGRRGDTATIQETVAEAGERITSIVADADNGEAVKQVSAEGPREVVTDKGYHSRAVVSELTEWGLRTYCSEPNRGRQKWQDLRAEQAAVYANRRRIRGERGRRLLRQRGEKLERWNQHLYDRGGMRRVHLRGRENILKRLVVHSGAANLGLLMRKLFGKGTPRGLQGRYRGLFSAAERFIRAVTATASLVRKFSDRMASSRASKAD